MKTQHKIAIVVFGALLIALALWFFIFRLGAPSSQPQKDLNVILEELTADGPGRGTNTPSRPSPAQAPVSLTPLTEEEKFNEALRLATTYFVERWATYSNQTTYESIQALESHATVSFAQTIPVYIADIKSQHPYQDGYYGMTTKVGSVSIPSVSTSATTVTVTASLRSEETIDSPDNTNTISQEAIVRLNLIQDRWLVDSLVINKSE